MTLYKSKQQAYYTNVRTDLVSLLPNNPRQKILEIGAGGGDTLVFIKENKLAEEVIGLDIFDLPNTNQNHDAIDKFIVADIERDNIELDNDYFDVIICGDVVEHLVNPWSTIDLLSGYLKKGGLLIVSTPNFRNWKNFLTIYLQGDFKYDPAGGLLDKTHLRFFCKKNIENLVKTDTLSCSEIRSINSFDQFKHRPILRLFNLITFNIFEQFFTSQYIVVGVRK